jgi:hypothetical protein
MGREQTGSGVDAGNEIGGRFLDGVLEGPSPRRLSRPTSEPLHSPAFDGRTARRVIQLVLAATLFSRGACTVSACAPVAAGERRPQSATPAVRDGASGRSEVIVPSSRLRVSNARLLRADDAAPDVVVLTFDLWNEATGAVTDLVLALGVQETATLPDGAKSHRLVVGPVALRSAAVLEPGASASYEVRLQNVPAGCACAPWVEIESVRAMP